MNKAEIFHLRLESFMNLRLMYGDVVHGRYDNTNTRMRLEVVKAMHEACCQELQQLNVAEQTERCSGLDKEAKYLLDNFKKIETGDTSALLFLHRFLKKAAGEETSHG